MAKLGAFFILAAAAFVQFAWATKPLAPSWRRMMCEKALISTGVYKPPVRARIHSPPDYRVDRKEFKVVVRNATGSATTYNRTDRDLFELHDMMLYPPEYLRLERLQGKAVLDLACGDGSLVEELRRKGVEVTGLDVFLNGYQMSKDYYVKAGADDTGFADATFDLILATQGPLTYESGDVLAGVLKEIARILKPGGRLLVSPVYGKEIWDRPSLSTASPEVLLKGTPWMDLPGGLHIVNHASLEWLRYPASDRGATLGYYWLEIRKGE